MDADVQALRKQVDELQNQLSIRRLTCGSPPLQLRTQLTVKEGRTKENKLRHTGFSRLEDKCHVQIGIDREDFFCYLCGAEGHLSTHCTAPEDPAKVIQKLMHSLRKYKEGNKDQSKPEPFNTSYSIRKSTVKAEETTGLPVRLVGGSSFSKEIIEGQPTTVLMDSGSSVSIVFESWYKMHLSHFTLSQKQCEPWFVPTPVAWIRHK